MPYLFDRIKETTTTTGTGTLTLAGAVAGFRTFASVLTNADTVYYVIEHPSTGAWECGTGIYSGSTLTRTVSTSSNANSLVNFAAGTKYVWCDVTAKAAVTLSAKPPGGRLTLSSVPVTANDVTGASTINYVPYVNNIIQLWDGSNWQAVEFSAPSMSLSGLTSGKPYDVFGYLSSNTLALERLIWTNDTTRATAVTYQDGRLCKSGDKTRLLLGTFYSTSTTATEDSVANRYLSNVYNQVQRRLHVCPGYNNNAANTSYSISTASFQEANGGTGSRCSFVLSNNQPSYCFMGSVFATSASAGANIGIGLDTATNIVCMAQSNSVSFLVSCSVATGYEGTLNGKHAWLCCMYSQAGTATFFADGANSVGGGSVDYKDTYLEGWVMG